MKLKMTAAEHLRNFLLSGEAEMHPGEMGFRHKDLLLRKGRGLCWVFLVLCFVPWYFFYQAVSGSGCSG